jgi:uncharacterized membrane protein YoaK (UPF0700 family)
VARISALVTVVALTAFVTANVVTAAAGIGGVPWAVNAALVAAAAAAAVLTAVAELYRRLDSRLDTLSDFLVVRLADLEARAADRGAGFAEGFLAGQSERASVVPLPKRAARPRASSTPDD